MILVSYEKSCDTKAGWYTHICKAIQHADSLMDQITLMKHPEVAYWCGKHRVYHVGRNKFMKPEVRAVYEPAAWSRGREMRLRKGAFGGGSGTNGQKRPGVGVEP